MTTEKGFNLAGHAVKLAILFKSNKAKTYKRRHIRNVYICMFEINQEIFFFPSCSEASETLNSAK